MQSRLVPKALSAKIHQTNPDVVFVDGVYLMMDEITGERVQLIERLAGRIADRIKNLYPEIQRIEVTVHKPKAPVTSEVADISVTISR